MNYEDKKKEIDLMEYWQIILKRKWVIVTVAGSLIFLVGVLSFLATPIYESTSTLLIEERTSKMLSIEEAFRYQSPVVRDLSFFNTQLELLKSKSLVERVARKLNILSRPEFGSGKKQKKSLLASVKALITFRWIASKKKSKDGKLRSLFPENPYSDIANAIRGGIKIRPIRDTKLVKVSYSSPFPVLSAEMVNTLSEEFISFSIEKRYERTQQASDFFSVQIATLREDLAVKERELQRYGKDKELFFLGDKESAAVNKFADLNRAYTQAQIGRIKAEAAYRELKDLDIDALPQSMDNPVVRQRTAEYTRIKNEYEEKSKIFKPSYPEMVQLKARLDSMKEELKKAVDAAESEYGAFLKREYSLKSLLDKQKENVARMNSSAILYNSLKIEVENKRRLLNSLVEKQNETLVSEKLGGIEAGNISIIDKAEVPKYPISPKKKLNLIMAFFLGVFGGICICFALEYFDNTVKGPEDVEKLTGLASLGVIPYLDPEEAGKKKRDSYYLGYKYSYGKENPGEEDALSNIKEIELVNYLYPKLSISEDYRTVRTSILLSNSETPPKTIAISSTLPKEGKTATVVNMAVSFSQLEERVLVVDSDLRKPRLHRVFKTRNVGGLSGYLTGKISLKDAIQKTSIKNIWILPSGLIPPNPAELLNSRKMKEMIEEIKNGFDVILFDTPPVLAVIDGVIVSSLADSTVLVINAGKLIQKPFLNAVEELRHAKIKIIGVIFNGLKVRKGNYFYMDSYRYYRSRYYGEEEGKGDKVEG